MAIYSVVKLIVGFFMASRFLVALSFPGERREYVEEVAYELAAALGKENVFYDNWYRHELARPNLDEYLQSIYLEQSLLIVPFLCADYAIKEWCGLEWRAIKELLKKKRDDQIMPMRFDSTNIPGLFSIDGYIDLTHATPTQVATYIVARVKGIPLYTSQKFLLKSMM